MAKAQSPHYIFLKIWEDSSYGQLKNQNLNWYIHQMFFCLLMEVAVLYFTPRTPSSIVHSWFSSNETLCQNYWACHPKGGSTAKYEWVLPNLVARKSQTLWEKTIIINSKRWQCKGPYFSHLFSDTVQYQTENCVPFQDIIERENWLGCDWKKTMWCECPDPQTERVTIILCESLNFCSFLVLIIK